MMKGQVERWWPERAAFGQWGSRLADFYETRQDYHRMTAGDTKLSHPQVKVLLALIQRGKRYAEVGSGSGEICGAVGDRGGFATGIDISYIAVERARERWGGGHVDFQLSGAEKLPFPDGYVDGVYSFEVVEHLWDPVAALREMTRILKPDGFLLVSCPESFFARFPSQEAAICEVL